MTLNLPEYDVKLRRTADGKVQVYDALRQKYVALTPEEWVRQHFVNYLTAYKGYPQYRLANEVGLNHNGTSRRCDTVVYSASARPIMIIEYKAPTISISVKVFDQIVRYNMVMNVEWLIVSNGVQHYCCRVDAESKSYQFVKEIPDYETVNAPKQKP